MTRYEFITASPDPMRYADLQRLVDEIDTWSVAFKDYSRRTNRDLRRLISDAKATYWNAQQAGKIAGAPAPSPSRKSTSCCITATEVNAWLETLPLWPLAGAQ